MKILVVHLWIKFGLWGKISYWSGQGGSWSLISNDCNDSILGSFVAVASNVVDEREGVDLVLLPEPF